MLVRNFYAEGSMLVRNDRYAVQSVFRAQDSAFKLVAQMQLGFYWSTKGEELATGTNPVVLSPYPGFKPGEAIGLGTAAAISMPLTPRLLFMARPFAHKLLANSAEPGLFHSVSGLVEAQSRQVYSRETWRA